MSFTLEEQETIITIPRDGDTVTVWSSHRPHVGLLRNMIQAKGFGEELSGDDYSATFAFPAERFKLSSAFPKKRHQTEEQREAARARMTAMHASKKEENR